MRALANHPDRRVRKAAFEAEIGTWESIAVPFAAALNGIKGFQQTVRRRRGYADDVEPTLLSNGINRASLEAMQQACVELFPDFRRYMAAKAKALGLERLAWFDLTAPLGESVRRYRWPEAEAFILENFRSYSDRLAAFAATAFPDRWIDAEPRARQAGRRLLHGPAAGHLADHDELRRLVQQREHAGPRAGPRLPQPEPAGPDLSSARHAQHTRGDGKHLLRDAGLRGRGDAGEPGGADRAPRYSAGAKPGGGRGYPLPLPVGDGVFAKRAERDLTVAELNALMTDAQRQTYGDGP